MSNEEIRNKHKSDPRTALPRFTLDEVKEIQNETRKDERAAVIEEIEKEKHNLKPKYAIRQIDIWLMEQKTKFNLLELP